MFEAVKIGEMNITSWVGHREGKFNVLNVAYYKDAWNLGLTYSHREYWFVMED